MTLSREQLAARLPRNGLGRPLHYFDSIGSTNDHAKQLAEGGAVHGTLVVADEQRTGRGRSGKGWHTPAGTALAISLLLRPGTLDGQRASVLNGVAALAVAEAIEARGGEAAIKWPNDVLVGGRKLCGVLVETSWTEATLEYAVMGIGVNALPGSAPPDSQVELPAVDLQTALGKPIDRAELLLDIVGGVGKWMDDISRPTFIRAWEQRLLFLQQWVRIERSQGTLEGTLLGLTEGGRLRLKDRAGAEHTIGDDVRRLRPVDSELG